MKRILQVRTRILQDDGNGQALRVGDYKVPLTTRPPPALGLLRVPRACARAGVRAPHLLEQRRVAVGQPAAPTSGSSRLQTQLRSSDR